MTCVAFVHGAIQLEYTSCSYHVTVPSLLHGVLELYICTVKSAYERATRVRACNYVKIETGWNFLPVLKIVTHTVQAAKNVNVAKRARDQCSVFSMVQ